MAYRRFHRWITRFRRIASGLLHDAGISGNAIHGSLDDLRRLAGLIEQRLREATPGDTLAVGKTYVPECEYDLVLEIRDAGFDPAGADPCLR